MKTNTNYRNTPQRPLSAFNKNDELIAGDENAPASFDSKDPSFKGSFLYREDNDIERSVNEIVLNVDQPSSYERTLIIYLKTLESKIKSSNWNETSIGSTYLNIGNIYQELGLYDEALNNYKKSLDLYKKNYGEEHLKVAGVYNNMGVTHKSKGDIHMAREYLQMALTVKLYPSRVVQNEFYLEND